MKFLFEYLREMTTAQSAKKNITKKKLFSLALMLCTWGYMTAPVQAEGSRDLVENGGDRPFTEWSTSKTANIERKTKLKVFVKSGETINLGSSVHSSRDSKDIVLRSPSGTEEIFDVKTSGEGFIDTVGKESAGPLPNAGGYTPYIHTATETGIYEVEFHAPGSGNPPKKSVTDAFPTDNSQKQAVSAWDITVRDSSGTTKNGRVFTNYVAMNMGGNNRSLNSEFFIQTKDGFLYRTAMNGVDPYGFIFFGNSRGFINQTDNSTLYRSTKADNNNLFPFQGNVQVQRPDVPDTLTDITHRVFFNEPDPDTLNELGIPTTPTPPPKPSNFQFTGAANGNQTYVGAGGNFSFSTNSAGSYEIIIDSDTDGIYDPSKDRVLQDVTTGGSEVVVWDGKDANGVDLPRRADNTPYNARIRLRTGEYHFPMLDAESNPNGFVIEMLNPPSSRPADFNRFTVYYNDENYTINGTTVNLDRSGRSSTPGIPTDPRNAATGINSSGGEHEFSGGYGDFLGIDTWAYFPSDAAFADIVITLGDVSGTLYEDSDGEDDFDTGEPRLPKDITVTLYNDANSNNVIDDGEEVATTVTDDNGDYIFDEVPDGDYKIKVDTTDADIPSGNTLGTPNDLTVTVTGGAVTNQNFGFDKSVATEPIILLVKRITAINETVYNNIVDGVDNGNPQSSNYVPAPKDAEDNNPNWVSNFLRGEIAGIKVQPNDEIEYTIYYLSASDTEAKNVLVCDRIPEHVTFIPNSFNNQPNRAENGLQSANRGILWFKDGNTQSLTNIQDGDFGRYFPPSIEPSSVYPGIDCDGDKNVNLPNTNGAVVVNLGNLPGADGEGNSPEKSYGYIRFRGRVK